MLLDVSLLWLTALQIFSGQLPYYEINNVDFLTMQLFLRKAPRRPSTSMSPNLTDKHWLLAKRCWGEDLNPETRPSAEELRLLLSDLHASALRLPQ